MKKLISAICIFIMLFSLCGCTDVLENGQPDGEIKSNGGIAIQQGDWIYFINGAMPPNVNDALDDTPASKIYRMKADGSELAAVSEKKAHNMYIYKEKIFYTTPTKKEVELRYVCIDRSGDEKLLTFQADEFITYGEKGVAVGTDDKIYYIEYETLNERVYETGNVDGIRISDNYIYYYAENEFGTKRIGIESGKTETLCDENGLILAVSDTEAFFVSTRLPYRVDANTLEKAQISTAYYQLTYINMANRVIICVESEEDSTGIYTQPIDNVAGRPVEEGGNKARKKIHTKNAVALCADDNYIYFVEDGTGDIYKMTYEGTEKKVLGTMQSIYRSDKMDIVGDKLFIFDGIIEGEKSGKIYYVPVDGSGELTVIKEQ